MARKRPPVLSSLSFILCVFGAGQLSAQSRWIEVPLPTQDTTLFRISFVDSTHGWVAGRSGVILATTDGGNTWRKDSAALTLPIFEFKFVLPNVGWLLAANPGPPGLQRNLYKSTDSGFTWIEKPLPDSLYVSAISFVSDSLVLVAGGQQLWATTNSVQSWEVRSLFPFVVCDQPRSLDFFDYLLGYASGSWVFPSPCFLETTDGGFSWIDRWQWEPHGSLTLRLLDGRLGMFWLLYFIEEPFPMWNEQLSLTWNRGMSNRSFSSLAFSDDGFRLGWATDSLNYWLLRRNGRILRTTDGGVNWQDDTLVVPITELMCDTYGHRFALGRGRLFYFDTTSTSVDERKTLPTHFGLCQNYPNPFNPSTQINFDLPVAGAVSLTIYDVLGRKVAELANGYREAGYHSVTWNAGARLASGVYLARFAVANEEGRQLYAKSMKLMLMK